MNDLVFYESRAGFKPSSIEIQKNTVYIRKNFKYVENKICDDNGNIKSLTYSWIYDEAKMTIPEFNEYVSLISAQNAINGVNDSSNITSILSGQQVNDFNQLAIMEAIVELFEMLTTMQTSTT